MSKLDKDQLDKISGGANIEKTENFRVDGEQGSQPRPIGVYLDGEEKNSTLDDAGGNDPSIGPNKG